MTGIGILWPLIRVLLDAVVLRIVAALVPGLRIDNWGTAFTAAIVLTVAGWVSGPLLGLTSLFLDGMELRGFAALIAAGALVTSIGFAPVLWGPVLRFLASEQASVAE